MKLPILSPPIQRRATGNATWQSIHPSDACGDCKTKCNELNGTGGYNLCISLCDANVCGNY